MAKEENTVFDVAKPGTSKPDTGSKPMVLGHKMIKDPTLKEDKEENIEDSANSLQTSTKKIKPLNKEKSESTNIAESVDKKIDDDSSSVSDTEQEESKSNDDRTTENEENKLSDHPEINSNQTTEESNDKNVHNEKSLQDNAVAQEENLQKIIKEKTYNVHIEEASAHAFKTFLKTFLIVVVIGLLVIVVLIDAEIIDLGVTLPFDIL